MDGRVSSRADGARHYKSRVAVLLHLRPLKQSIGPTDPLP
jgi:hypothetical protein